MRLISLCDSCVRMKPSESDVEDAPGTCEAFPNGIPDEIWFEQFDHRRPLGSESILYLRDPDSGKSLSRYESLVQFMAKRALSPD